MSNLTAVSDPEYAARTHRLVIKGGVFEHFYPETSDMTEPEFYQLIDGLNANAGVRNQILLIIPRDQRMRRTAFGA